MRVLRYVFLVVAVVALAVSLRYVGMSGDRSETAGPRSAEGGAAALFDAPSPAAPFDIETLEGAPVSSTDVAGDILVLDFWATWCGPCLVEIPHYNAIHADYDGCGVRMMGITMQSGSADRVRDFVSGPIRAANGEHRMEYPIYMGNDTMAAAYGPVFGFPTTVLVDHDGSIRKRWIGALPDKSDQIRLLVDALLDEQGRECGTSAEKQDDPHRSGVDPEREDEVEAADEIAEKAAGTG